MKIFVARVFKNIPLNVKNIKVKFFDDKTQGLFVICNQNDKSSKQYYSTYNHNHMSLLRLN